MYPLFHIDYGQSLLDIATHHTRRAILVGLGARAGNPYDVIEAGPRSLTPARVPPQDYHYPFLPFPPLLTFAFFTPA